MKYEKSYIYVMQFEYTFQYLFLFESDIHQDRIEVLPGFFKRVLWKLGFIKSPYVREQIEQYETAVICGAMEKLDEFNSPKFKKARRKEEAKLQSARAKTRLKSCVWQTRVVPDQIKKKEISYYYCLTHREVVRMKDGVAPVHK